MFHVGRLDKLTTGLLLVTDDGDLACRLCEPASGCQKTYLARVRCRSPLEPTEGHIRRLTTPPGMKLADGFACAEGVSVVER